MTTMHRETPHSSLAAEAPVLPGALVPTAPDKLPQQPRVAPPAPLPLLADRDQFTALVGRQMAACRRMGSRPAVLIIEVDAWGPGRKPIAPERWPALLQAIGARLKSRVRATDLLAQWGERRFGVVLLGCGSADLPGVQARLAASLRGVYSLDPELLQVELHMGASAQSDVLLSGGELVSAAEAALMTRH